MLSFVSVLQVKHVNKGRPLWAVMKEVSEQNGSQCMMLRYKILAILFPLLQNLVRIQMQAGKKHVRVSQQLTSISIRYCLKKINQLPILPKGIGKAVEKSDYAWQFHRKRR